MRIIAGTAELTGDRYSVARLVEKAAVIEGWAAGEG